ncbi:MAG: MFS transporter [Tepidisphaera sp.]|nr:MFS transporter [Tepidisphaera sp.]
MESAAPLNPREHEYAPGQLPPVPDAPPPDAQGPKSGALKFIFITLLLEVLGFGLFIPVGPKLIQELLDKANPGSGTPDEAARYFGLLVASFALMQFFFAPVLGAVSDRFGRRPVLLISILGSGLDYFAMALSPFLWVLYITRMLNGMSGATISVCNAYIADITPPHKRAGAYGIVGAAFGLGFVIGPAVGGLLGEYDIRLPFYVAGSLAIINWLYGCFVLPESLRPENRSRLSIRRMNPVAVFGGLRDHPLAKSMAGSFFLLNMAMFGLQSTWVLYTASRYHWTEFQVGLSLTCVGIGAAIVQGGLARKIIPALGPGPVGERRAVLIGLLIGCCAYIGYGAADKGWMIYTIISVASLGGIAQPAAMALITRTVRPDEQGAVQGGIAGINSIAMIIAPLIATKIFSLANPSSPNTSLWAQHPGLSFYYCSFMAFLGLLAALWATRHVERDTLAQAAS